ncbi:MAG: hypothetical protein DRJ40_11470 [Thermoprotei archaeon]|nr:MAG: hypothetical protein DRJ40_11470 [Thermoprotei archaeon]
MKEIRFRLRDADYEVLRAIARNRGYTSVNEFVKHLVLDLIENRIVIDQIDWNNLVSKVNHLHDRIDDLETKLVELEKELNDLKNKLKGTLLFKVR